MFPYLKTQIVSDFTSKEDLVQAIATSCHIPAYNDGSFVKEFRGQVGKQVSCVRVFCFESDAGQWLEAAAFVRKMIC